MRNSQVTGTHADALRGDVEHTSLRSTGRSEYLRIATLSWSMPKHGGALLSPDVFLSTLGELRQKHKEALDILLASGMTLSGEPSPAEVLAKTSGSPVLFEVINDNGTARWVLAHASSRDTGHRVRSEQILFRSNDNAVAYDSLSSQINEGAGVIRLVDRDVSFVLLICGENNALNVRGRGQSAFKRPTPDLAKALGCRWLVLNPAHSAYWPQSKMTGFAKVGRVAGVGETMARAVARRSPYPDGTTPPIRFIHVNNFLNDRPKTRDYASLVFGPDGRMAPESLIEGDAVTRTGDRKLWLAATYSLLLAGSD